MRKSPRRFRFERLEARNLLAAFGPDEPQGSVASVALENASSIEVSEVQGLRGAALEISFDHRHLQVDPRDVRAGSAWGGKGMSIANVDNEEGTINVFVYSVRETEQSHGSIVEIDFRRKETEPGETSTQIDVNRLRVNDGDVTFSDAETDKSIIQEGRSPAKLSLQFNIAPEGESSKADGLEIVGVPETQSAGSPVASETEASTNHGNNLFEIAKDQRASGVISLIASDAIDVGPLEVCRPGEGASVRLDPIATDVVAAATEIMGPAFPTSVQGSVFYAPPMSSPLAESDSIPLMTAPAALPPNDSRRTSDFSLTIAPHSQRHVALKRDSESDEAELLRRHPVDHLFADTAFQTELSTVTSR